MHAALTGLVNSLLLILVLFLKPPGTVDLENPVATNLAALLPDDSAKWLVKLLNSIDIISFWTLILLAGRMAIPLDIRDSARVDGATGLRAVVAWPSAPRPVCSTDLLPERALAGDPEAERQLIDIVARPLEDAGGALMETVDGYLEVGGVLESCARKLFVHPNTVRYRLRRVTELTGHNASVARDALVLQVGLAVGRLARARGLW